MPVEFLTDEQVAAYRRFVRPPSRTELERFFLLNDRDRELVEQRRRPDNRLGFAVQLGNRVLALARYGLSAKAPTLRQLAEPRRTATLVATIRHLEQKAIDDALDLFAVLMQTKLLAWAERESAKEQLGKLPRFAAASAKLAVTIQILFDASPQAEYVSRRGLPPPHELSDQDP